MILKKKLQYKISTHLEYIILYEYVCILRVYIYKYVRIHYILYQCCTSILHENTVDC